ncbi:hypothetical protein [Paeniglutamicibacter sp. Y32M11]|uniref:hypothetical protein n=1 Tax=Paeniglutamicibacter sp. Y32M11 TaxID=2853258 RepID=UPI00104DFF50|nr:hypothetical protein [Paeniglutamicibacter sp. Y32M11]QXQ11814.1 hypothetical protein KUF55_08060 [Paeniglutamicibacter sp. Y32M11]
MKFIKVLFLLFLAAFMLGGLILVTGQVVGVLTLNGALVSGSKAALSGATFAAATAAGLCAFVLQYSKAAATDEG